MATNMKNFLLLFSIVFLFTGCGPWHIKGYTRNPFELADVLWEAPVDINSEEEQVFEVPFVRYGNHFSICFESTFDSNEDDWRNMAAVSMSFLIGDSTFSGGATLPGRRPEGLCLGRGADVVSFKVPQGLDLETGGTLKVKFFRTEYLKKNSNPKVLLVYSSALK